MTRLEPRPRAGGEQACGAPLPRLDPITRLPILILFPHSRCNCRCVMCDIWKSSSKDEISTRHVEGWIREWQSLGVRRIVLSGGEPLLHGDFKGLATLLIDAGFGITLISTGLLLKRDAEWVAQYCDDVVVSLDGPRSVHNRIRDLPTAYDKLKSGVTALRAAAGRAGRSLTITARCTVQRLNADYLRATLEAAKDVGVDHLSFLAADTSSEAFNRQGGWPVERAAEVGLDVEGLARLSDELAALEQEHADDFQKGFLVESPGKLRARLVQYFAASLGRGAYAPIDCNAPWVSTVVEADGTVRPCFFQPPLGNLFEAESLGALLNSPEAMAWRKGLDTRRNAICKRCVCSLNLQEG